MSLDAIFSSPTLQSLRLTMDDTAMRQTAISSNIANVNTPGYQRVDISSTFQQAYTDALRGLGNGNTSVTADNMPDASIQTASVQGPARPDGNTVQIEQEMLDLAQNSAKYEFAGQVMSSNFHGLKYAITGQE
jgi:flagellar basal-body rod protein FlgB